VRPRRNSWGHHVHRDEPLTAPEGSALARVQFTPPPGVIDLGPGQPDPALAPTALLATATSEALCGDDSPLAYGPKLGPASLLRALSEHLGRVDALAPPTACLLITAGASAALDLICTHHARAGRPVLVEDRTYDLARQLFLDRGLTPVPVPSTAEVLNLTILQRTLEDLTREQRPPAFLYVIPTFHNPTGRVMPETHRRDLLSLADRYDLMIVEDDVYRQLYYDQTPPASLWSMSTQARVLRVGSFSKWVAPGLRVGWLTAPVKAIQQYEASGFLRSGGGPAHFAASIIGAALADGRLETHGELMRTMLRKRRDTLANALTQLLPPGFQFSLPAGGYFIWLRTPTELNLDALDREATTAGIRYYRADRFGPQPDSALRLAFSHYPPNRLIDGARRLATAASRVLQAT
jgi:2-aminoadipate transaminase